MTLSSEDLRRLYNEICECTHPEQLFTEASGSPEAMSAEVNRKYRELLATCHPDLYCGRGDGAQYLATEIARAINLLREEALQRIQDETFGHPHRTTPRRGSTVIRTRAAEYRVLEKLAAGAVADVYLAEYDVPGGGIESACIKIARDRADNGLMVNEQNILRAIKHKSMPLLVETFTTGEGHAASVVNYLDESHDLVAVRENPRYQRGVPAEHVCWVLERLLSVLGYLHHNLVVHGNLEPGNILVRPRDHNAFLIDFVFSVKNPAASDYIRCATEPYSPPEVRLKSPPLPTTDLYALGQCMIYLIGGDPASGQIPEGLDARLVNFLRHLVNPDPRVRAKDAWEMHAFLSRLRTDIFGPRRFVEFVF